MNSIIRNVIWAAVVIGVCILCTLAIHITNYREYIRYEDAYGHIMYLDSPSWFERLSSFAGPYIAILVWLASAAAFFCGVRIFVEIVADRYHISKFILYTFSLWLLIIAHYALVTSQFGASFVLQPFYGPKVHYGGYHNIINSIEHNIEATRHDSYLSNDEKVRKIRELSKRLDSVLMQLYEENSHAELQKEILHDYYSD